MRISDLSAATGVPVATIKFYLREGLLPGAVTDGNRAEYGDEHVARLRLIRSLVGIGRLSLSATRELFGAMDGGCSSSSDVRALVNPRLLVERSSSEFDDGDLSTTRVDELIDQLGWQVGPEAVGRRTLAHVFTALRRLGCDGDVTHALMRCAASVQSLASLDDAMPSGPPETVLARMVLLDVACRALLRLAHEHRLASMAEVRAVDHG